MDINALVQALQTLNAEDAFRARLSVDQWRLIAPYLTRHEIRAGDLLIKQGDADRTMYFLEQGSLQIFVTGGPPGHTARAPPTASPARERLRPPGPRAACPWPAGGRASRPG